MDFTDLILLIGTNPLPNVVVGKYFVKNNSLLRRIWLVHSEKNDAIKQKGTMHFAENIKKILINEKAEIEIEFISLSNICSKDKIFNDLKETLFIQAYKSTKLHLNYTGGTKSMAVHVYRTLEDEYKDNCSFSYLDTREFKIVEDDTGRINKEDLRNEVNLSFEELIELHDYERRTKDYSENILIVWSNTLKVFREIIKEGKLDEYINWKPFLRDSFYNEKGFVKNIEQFNKLNRIKKDDKQTVENFTNKINDSTFTESVLKILKSMPSKYSLLEGDNTLFIPKDKTHINNRLKPSIKEFLDGKWLEAYIYKVIEEKSKEENKHSIIDTNWKIKRKGQEKQGKDFELDVIVINGYQICGISCTTFSHHAMCKSKGFELLHRVNQIGGEESKAILVTLLKNYNEFAEDIKTTSGSTDDKLLVLGIKDLEEEILWRKIRNHIWEGQ